MLNIRIGDYVEIMRPMLPAIRGIVLEVDREHGLWPACRIYVFNQNEILWYYEYEITIISEAGQDDRTIQGVLSCVGE